jgi:hypothetical protein
MTMTTLPNTLGQGGTGIENAMPRAIRELAGLSIDVLVGAKKDTKIEVPAIRTEDTILSAWNVATGVISDVTANMSIVSTKATGTLVLDTVIANETATVNGVVFTCKAAPSSITHFLLGDTDAETTDNLAATLNAYQTRYGGPSPIQYVAESDGTDTVTITAYADGTAGNAITIVGDDTITASGATLSGGTATGGVVSDADQDGDQIILFWFNKR